MILPSPKTKMNFICVSFNLASIPITVTLDCHSRTHNWRYGLDLQPVVLFLSHLFYGCGYQDPTLLTAITMSSLSNLNSLPTQAKTHVCEQAFSSQHKLQKAHFEVIVFLRTLWSTHQLTYSSRNCVRSKKIIIHRYQNKDTIL